MNDFLNPYIAGAPVVEPSMFFGRQDVFDWIEQNLSGRYVSHILVIHGQRRVGKTSVLKQIPNHLPSHFIYVFLDLQGRTHTTLDRFQWWLAREICRAVSQARGLSIPVPDRDLFAQDGEYLAATFLPQVLASLGDAVLLLTFDEFDSLSEAEIQQSLARPLITYLRRLFETSKLNFIFSIGSSGHKLENMQASYTEFFKTALYRKISFLKAEDCAHLITQPVEGMITYIPAAVERIHAITSGHPYFTQLICHELFSLSQKSGRRTITREDVESVLEDVIERGTVNLKFVWDEANDLEKWVLACLAHELQGQELEMRSKGFSGQPMCNDRQLADALHQQRVRCSENELNTALVHLREKDVITQDNRFVVELLCIWLSKNRPLDRVREELVQVNPIANRYNEIGDEFHELGQHDKAFESFRQALATDPTNLRAQVSIANLHLENHDYDQAVEGFEAALRIDDDDIVARGGYCTALMELGESATAVGDLAGAVAFYQRVLDANPDHPEAHLHSANLFTRQAEDALSGGDAERAMKYFARALEHCPEDQQINARYAQVKAEHTKKLVISLLEESRQAQERQEWNIALDTVQRALQLAPNEPTLLKHLATVKDAPRQAKIASLSAHAKEMERTERWEEAVLDWESCLGLNPPDEQAVRSSLEHSRQRQRVANDYTQAQLAIKEKRYGQAIALLQGIIAQDASYKDAAVLLVECLKVKPKRQLVLPKLPKFSIPKISLPAIPISTLRWVGLTLVLVAAFVGVATQWTRIRPIFAGISAPKTPIATQAGSSSPPSTLTAGIPLATATSTGQAEVSFLELRNKFTGYLPSNVQDDFSSTSLQEYWNIDKGVQNATLQDGFLSLNNEFLIGDESLKSLNYILQVDLRFSGISENETFVYGLRLTPTSENLGTEYLLNIKPSTGEWFLKVITDPQGEYTVLQQGDLGVIMPVDWHELGVILYDDSIYMSWNGKIFLTQDNVELFGSSNHFGLDASTAGLAALDIDNWRFWDLGAPAYMHNYWVHSAPSTFMEGDFSQDEGWKFSPLENEKYENGKIILYANNAETGLTREDFQASNIAVQISFSPTEMPDTASLGWFLGKDLITGNMLTFDYYPASGYWQISQVENDQGVVLASGWIAGTSPGSVGSIMVVKNGDRVSAFYEDTFLGSAVIDRTDAGTWNELIIQGKQAVLAQVEILSIDFWNLDTVEWTTDEWITARPESLVVDSFMGNEGLRFNPVDAEKFVDGKAVLFTEGEDIILTHEDIQGVRIALEVSFKSVNMPDAAALVWNLGKDSTSLDCLEFSYYPDTGAWQINKVVNRSWELLASGTTQPTPDQAESTIMVVSYGNQVIAFLNGMRIGSVDIATPVTSLRNEIVIRNRENIYSRADISKIRFWDFDSGTSDAGNVVPTAEQGGSLSEMADTLTAGREPNFTTDFSGPTLNPFFQWAGAPAGTLLDGALRVSDYIFLRARNYILQVDLRLDNLNSEAEFGYTFRNYTFSQDVGMNYILYINPTTGKWSLLKNPEVQEQSITVQEGTIQPLEQARWYQLGVIVDGDILRVYLDDQLLLQEENINVFGNENYFGLISGEGILDISNWNLWYLEPREAFSWDDIVAIQPTFGDANFAEEGSWQVNPGEDGRFQDGRAILSTAGGSTTLTHEQIYGRNFALLAAFSSTEMPDSAYLEWNLRVFDVNGDRNLFRIYPSRGYWKLLHKNSLEEEVLAEGTTNSITQASSAEVMVVLDGDYFAAYLDGKLLAVVEDVFSGSGTGNELILHSDSNAEVGIIKIAFWNLDEVKWSNYELLTSNEPAYVEDNFTAEEFWTFSPPETESFVEGRAILANNSRTEHTRITSSNLRGVHLALEVTFIPRFMADPSYLLWYMRDNSSICHLYFDYNPATGSWQIGEEDSVSNVSLVNGIAQPTTPDTAGRIMLATDGEQISAFVNGVFLGTATTSKDCLGADNSVGVINETGEFTQVDITKIEFWILDD